MQGRRRDDTRQGDLPPAIQPGDYWKVLDKDGLPLENEHPGKLTRHVWYVVAPGPNGPDDHDDWLLGNLANHTVREHEDGTISVRPGDGSSNSILIRRRGYNWHGYIEHGIWRRA